MKNTLKKLIVNTAVLLSVFCSACGPSLQSTMPVPPVVVLRSELHEIQRPPSGASVYVDNFYDVRKEPALVTLDGREVKPEGDVANNIIQTLQGVLRKVGYEFSDVAPVIISGEVRKWVVDVSGGIKKKASADAELFIEVLDPANKRAYSGIYTGYASIESPNLSNDSLKKLLQTSMKEAVKQLINDRQFLKVLESF